jgi:MYXO-CTERM domain-containing protein
MKKFALAALLSVGAAAPAMAQFVNGGFETGNTTGWVTGTGARDIVDNPELVPSDYLPGGKYYNASLQHSAVVSTGTMAHTNGTLNQVYSGNYSFRAEDLTSGGYASAITQTVDNYQSNNIFFAWAATLEGAHGVDQAATFQLVLTDNTTGHVLVDRQYNAADNGSGVDSRFTLSNDNFYFTSNWQVESLDVSAYKGDSFTLTLLAADCSPTAHEGTVYLDGFGAVTPPTSPVPEASNVAMLMGGLGLFGLLARRRRAAAGAR